MASGHAQRKHESTGKRVLITDGSGKPRWHEIWENNPAIARQAGPDVVKIRNAAGCRPYIESWEGVQKFSDWRAADNIGRICLTEDERAFASAVKPPFVIIEPNIKPRANPNKDWGFDRYQQLVDAMPELPWLQFDYGGSMLDGVRKLKASGFRRAAAVLSVSLAYVGAEGALHHAAAAFVLPAVVLFGSASSVKNLGYPTHRNMVSGEPCGRWAPCKHCRENMDAISVEMVADAVRETVLG